MVYRFVNNLNRYNDSNVNRAVKKVGFDHIINVSFLTIPRCTHVNRNKKYDFCSIFFVSDEFQNHDDGRLNS